MDAQHPAEIRSARCFWQSRRRAQCRVQGPLAITLLTLLPEAFEMTPMVDEFDEAASQPPVDAVICIDGDALSQLGPVVRHLCVGLVDLRAKVRVVTPSPSAARLSVGPVQLLVHKDLVWPLRRNRFRAIVDSLSAQPPAVIYAISAGSFGIGARLAEVFEIDLVVQVNSDRDVDALDGLGRHRASRAVVASEPLLKMVQERWEDRADAIALVRPGIARGAERTCFADENKQASLICSARLESRNGVDVIIEAAGILRQRGHSLLTFLTAEGPMEAALRRAVHTQRLSEHVTFARTSAELVQVLRAADLFVVPPGERGVCAPPLEAMANGTAVICFDGGGADFLHDGRTALVCREHTGAALADMLERILNDFDLARRVADNAREYVKQNHSISVMAERTMDILRELALPGRTFSIRN